MSRENIKVVKSFYKSVLNGDNESARMVLDPNVEWIERNGPSLWFSGTHRGPDEVFKKVIEPTFEKIAKFSLDIKKYYEVGDYVVVLGRFYGRGKITGKELRAPTAHIWTLRNGKAVRFEAYHDTASWLEALGATTERMAA